jgi:hypothetical protein
MDFLYERMNTNSANEARSLGLSEDILLSVSEMCLNNLNNIKDIVKENTTKVKDYRAFQNLVMGFVSALHREITKQPDGKMIWSKVVQFIYIYYAADISEHLRTSEISVAVYDLLVAKVIADYVKTKHYYDEDKVEEKIKEIEKLFAESMKQDNVRYDPVVRDITPAPTPRVTSQDMSGGGKSRKKYNGHSYVVRTGVRGGKYILVKGNKKYI